MDRFSISQLEQFSGIRSHTIRIWEKRYNALTPVRSAGNTRYYDNSQLRRLLNIASLLDKGYKISELGSMPDKEMFRIIDENVNTASVSEPGSNYFVFQFVQAGMSFDEPYFEKLFATCMLRWGLKDLYSMIIYPMLKRIGLMWSSNSIPPAQEHFISNLIRQKLSSAIDLLPPPFAGENVWLLFLPENEYHETGLLFAHYIIRSRGKKVIYLGANVPFESLVNAVKQTSASDILLFFVHHDLPENILSYLNSLKKAFKKTRIHISGSEKLLSDMQTEKEFVWLHSVDDLYKIVL